MSAASQSFTLSRFNASAAMYLLILAMAACLSGCGLSERQAQHLADGLVGIEAGTSLLVEDPSPAAAAAVTILAGAHDQVAAAAAGETMPPPTKGVAAIAADPAGYRTAAAAAKREAETAAAAVPWWGWLGGAAAAAVGLCRLLPGPGGMLADAVWRILSPGCHAAADAERETQATGFRELVGLIEGLHNDDAIRTLKQHVTTKASSDVRDAIQGLVVSRHRLASLGHAADRV